MPEPHERTRDVLTEADAPQVQTIPVFRTALGTFRPSLDRLSQQASVFQGLVGAARDSEPNEGIRQKYTGLEMAAASVQAKHNKALEHLNRLRDACEGLEREIEELRGEVARQDEVEAGR